MPSTPNSSAAPETPSIKSPRSVALRSQSTPDLLNDIGRARSTQPPQPPRPPTPPPVITDSPVANGRGIQRSKSWTETIFSPLFNVVPFLRSQESEEESQEAAKQQNENRQKFGRTSTSSLTADETLESSEAEPDAQEKESEQLRQTEKDASQESAVDDADSERRTEATAPPPPATYEQPAAYTLEEVEEVEVFDPCVASLCRPPSLCFSFVFIRSLPPLDPELRPAALLPAKAQGAPRITLVLDLDETLVHCTTEMPMSGFHFEFPVVFGGVSYQVRCARATTCTA